VRNLSPAHSSPIKKAQIYLKLTGLCFGEEEIYAERRGGREDATMSLGKIGTSHSAPPPPKKPRQSKGANAAGWEQRLYKKKAARAGSLRKCISFASGKEKSADGGSDEGGGSTNCQGKKNACLSPKKPPTSTYALGGKEVAASDAEGRIGDN